MLKAIACPYHRLPHSILLLMLSRNFFIWGPLPSFPNTLPSGILIMKLSCLNVSTKLIFRHFYFLQYFYSIMSTSSPRRSVSAFQDLLCSQTDSFLSSSAVFTFLLLQAALFHFYESLTICLQQNTPNDWFCNE